MTLGESAPVTPPAGPSLPPLPALPTTLTPSLNGTTPHNPVPAVAPKPAPTPAEQPEPPAPADRDRTRGRWQRLAWYAGTTLLAFALIAAGLRLDEADLAAPFSQNEDVLLILPMVKATLERGSHWRNERLGSPGILEMHDFPVVDHLHFAIIWLLGKVVRNYVVVFNLYYLLTYPLCALTAMLALRHLRLTLPAAAAGGVLYAFLPYHWMRGESHYFLSAYWVVPLSLLPALAVCRGELPFFPRAADGTRPFRPLTRATLWQVLLGAATASAGAYYAFFACALYAVAGVYGGVANRTWRAVASAGVLIALVAGFGVLNHLPTFGHVGQYGRNGVTDRDPEEAEYYGLKLAQLVLPIDDHNLQALGRLKSMYNTATRSLNNENGFATLGAVGSVGLLGLMAVMLLPGRRGWPFGPLAALTGFILLFSTTGGLGGVFNLLVLDQVRCYNRFSIYLAFLCLFALLWPLDHFLLSRTTRRPWLRYAAFGGLVALGLSDQTPAAWFRPRVIAGMRESAARFDADRRFFREIEEKLGPGGKVFCLPYAPFPEIPPVNAMSAYDHMRGYLHTDALAFSYGSMKGRECDAWQEEVSFRPADELLRRVVFAGFDGIYVDTRGFAVTDMNQGNRLAAELREAAAKKGGVALPMVVHESQKQVFLDVRPYRDWWRAQDPAGLAAEERREREWVALTWLRGFYSSFRPYGQRNGLRWASKSATLAIVNPSDRTRTFKLTATFGVEFPDGVFRVRIDGGGLEQVNRPDGPGPWLDEVEVEHKPGDWDTRNYGPRKEYVVRVPPGRHFVRFRCEPPEFFRPGDPRPLCYFLKDITFTETP